MTGKKENTVLSDILIRAVNSRTQKDVAEGDLSDRAILKELHMQPAVAKMVLTQMQAARDEDEKARILIAALSVYRSMEALRGIDGVPQAKKPIYNDDLSEFINVESGHKLDDQMPLHYLNMSLYQSKSPAHWIKMLSQLHKNEKMGLQRLLNNIYHDSLRYEYSTRPEIRIQFVRDIAEAELATFRNISPTGARFIKRSFQKR